MSEPDISNLARNLAEQNNVDWRRLVGSGPDGRVVERDVLDYLARVMAGEEAVDPTPEPLPEGMEAWPDQDAPSYFTGGSSQGAGAYEPEEADQHDPLTDTLQEAGQVYDLDDADQQDPLSDTLQAPDHVEQVEGVQDAVEEAVQLANDTADDLLAQEPWSGDPAEPTDSTALIEDEPFSTAAAAEDDDFSADIFLFDDDDADAGAEPAEGQAGEVAVFEEALADAGSSYEYGSKSSEESGDGEFGGGLEGDWTAADSASDAADDLLVADDEFDVERVGHSELLSTAEGAVPYEEPYRQTFEQSDDDAALGASLGGYDKEFVTPSEQLGGDAGDEWSTSDSASDLHVATGYEAGVLQADETELPDLWEGDAGGGGEGELAFGGLDEADELGSTDDEWAAPAVVAAEDEGQPYELAGDDTFGDQAVDDVQDLEQAEALDELDSVDDLASLDGEVEPEPAAAVAPSLAADQSVAASLPLARTGTMLRRHIDLSALAGAQVAAGQELGLGEPIGVAPFLLRAAAKAVSELGGVSGQVALAELDGELSFRRVDDAAGRGFSELIEELAAAGSEEDELGLAVVDLSGYDMDEVVLDVEVPTLTLGRVLYDTQRGAHRSTLTLSGELPFDHGAKLLARVADLLDAPVRLFV